MPPGSDFFFIQQQLLTASSYLFSYGQKRMSRQAKRYTQKDETDGPTLIWMEEI